ncbi:unnamed protein product, partial [Rotaria magnacalcarata]
LYIHGNHNIRFKIYTLMVIRVSIKNLYPDGNQSFNQKIIHSSFSQYMI